MGGGISDSSPQAGWQAGRQARQAGRQAGRPAGKQAGKAGRPGRGGTHTHTLARFDHLLVLVRAELSYERKKGADLFFPDSISCASTLAPSGETSNKREETGGRIPVRIQGGLGGLWCFYAIVVGGRGAGG